MRDIGDIGISFKIFKAFPSGRVSSLSEADEVAIPYVE